MTVTLDKHLREQGENEAFRRDEGLLLSLLQGCGPVQRGATWKCLCPVHQERTPSCTVREGRDGAWRWHCFGCGVSGDVLDLVMRLERCSFRQARERLGARAVAPAVVAAPKRVGKPYLLACEASWCPSTVEVDMMELAVALSRGEFRGGEIARWGDEIAWLCRRHPARAA